MRSDSTDVHALESGEDRAKMWVSDREKEKTAVVGEQGKAHVFGPVVFGRLPVWIHTEVLGILPLEYDKRELPS